MAFKKEFSAVFLFREKWWVLPEKIQAALPNLILLSPLDGVELRTSHLS